MPLSGRTARSNALRPNWFAAGLLPVCYQSCFGETSFVP